MEQEDQNYQGTEAEQDAAEPREERGSRMDAAKAWFRAMNAGGDELPNLDIGGQEQPARGSAGGPCRNCESLEIQLREAEQKASEAESLYKRMAADFDNYRRRIDREREEFQVLGVQKMAEAMLPALDDMDRAMGSLNADMPSDKVLESLNLVYNRITKCMEQVGLKPLNAMGEPFDPRFHEPVQEIETSDFPDGSVMQELRRGYILNEKVIRPALVNVASNVGGSAPVSEEPRGAERAEEDDGVKVYDLTDFADDDEEVTPPQQESEDDSEPPSGNPKVDE